jgi:hypothetical protein
MEKAYQRVKTVVSKRKEYKMDGHLIVMACALGK